ncbi:PPE domain-containing protein, partial [Mycobacterium tuberculosis]
MNFSVLPPEINSGRMFFGAGSGPMLAAAAAWDGLAAELGLAAESFGLVTSGLAGGSGQAWQGAAAAAMVVAAAPYAGWLAAAAARAGGAAVQAKAVAGAFEAARAAMVDPVVVAANRSAFVQLVLSNVFGQNAPAIAAAEATYEQMWAADVAAMVGYHGGASAAAAALAPWQQAVPGLLGLLDSAQSSAQAVTAQAVGSTVPGPLQGINFGFGNIGSLNLGSGNTGDTNVGSGNIGNTNLGGGNIGSFNLGSGNQGDINLGIGNVGNLNLGSGNFGSQNLGSGNIGSTNVGSGNIGSTNVGSGNIGDTNFGNGNNGNFNFGSG